MYTFMQGKIKNIHVYNTVMKFVYRHVYNYIYMYFLDKKINSTCIPKVFYVSDKKDENSLSIKGKCFKYNVQCSNILGKKHNISYISI